MSDVIGKCYICKKDVTDHDIKQLATVLYCAKWPGDHLCCVEHPGVRDDYDRLIATGGNEVTNGNPKNPG